MANTHTTNRYDTLIQVSEDCRKNTGSRPQGRGEKTGVAEIQFELISGQPYHFTSDELLFEVFARRKALAEAAYPKEKERFFSKGQPCLRTSPLVKIYGFGIHFNREGKIALVGMESREYQRLLTDPSVKKLKGMRSRRK